MINRSRACDNELPANALTSTVPHKANEAVLLIAIEVLDRVVQPLLRIQLLRWRQRIVNAYGPILFLERHENSLLIWRRQLELLYDLVTHPKFVPIAIPARHAWSC